VSSSPPEGYEARPLEAGDAAAAAALLNDHDQAHLDEIVDHVSEHDVLDWWLRHDLGRESISASAGGKLAAFGLLMNRREDAASLNAFVHPARCGHGLGSFLLDWAEEQAVARRALHLRAEVAAKDTAGRTLVEARGLRQVRSGFRMVIDLESRPADPDWPEGFVTTPLRAGEERALYEVMEEAFAEEWSREPRSFGDWESSVFAQASFDPTLCFLVRAGQEVVAAEMCSQRFGMGWIGSLGVRPSWRRRGLGEALLREGFVALHARGERRVGLGVDAQNPTGATRLYERVGMRVAAQEDTYEKELP